MMERYWVLVHGENIVAGGTKEEAFLHVFTTQERAASGMARLIGQEGKFVGQTMPAEEVWDEPPAGARAVEVAGLTEKQFTRLLLELEPATVVIDEGLPGQEAFSVSRDESGKMVITSHRL